MLMPSLRAPAPIAGSDPAARGGASVAGDDPVHGGRATPLDATLAPGSGEALGHLWIPAIGLDTTVFEGVSDAALADGPGHWPETALPGERGNAVFAGYRLAAAAPFANLYRVESGDEIHVTVGSDRAVYRVFETLAVDAEDYPDVVLAEPARDARILTLFACHPYGSQAKRFVVRARAVVQPAG